MKMTKLSVSNNMNVGLLATIVSGLKKKLYIYHVDYNLTDKLGEDNGNTGFALGLGISPAMGKVEAGTSCTPKTSLPTKLQALANVIDDLEASVKNWHTTHLILFA
ncbi:hypothetical protein L2E82_02575 [Cichorium intybus]|uniref:Uncharacterized protein n=1 Tax=Cichorium intybus TaxID=13427 RepID=A0ACB9H2P2_CICIN|nr:hypothetical protein L2E82_02575 [Cichorium intybus]